MWASLSFALIRNSLSDATKLTIYQRNKHLTPRFGRDISVRSVIYPTGRPSCFRGKPNINVLPTLIIRRIIRRRTVCDFATFRFGTFPVSLAPINGPVRIAIGSGPQICLQKFLTPRFGRDISVRSVIYPTGRPSYWTINGRQRHRQGTERESGKIANGSFSSYY